MRDERASGPEAWVWDLVDLAAAQAAANGPGMEAAMRRLHKAGRELEVEEALLQSYLFLGFPSAIEGLRRWRMIRPGSPDAAEDGWEAWRARGAEVCARVYGEAYTRLRRNIERLHPDLDRWMVVEGYGKVLGRPGLDLSLRELLIVAMLVVQGPPARRQLRSHLRGALNAGAPPERIEGAIRRASRFATRDDEELAGKLWSNLRETS